MTLIHHDRQPERGGPPIGRGAVHVWFVPSAAAWRPLPELFDLLTNDERARADRYRLVAPREQFILARATLRLLLGSVLNREPGEVKITVEADGKPVVEPRAVHFSVSHTEGVCLIVLAAAPVGADVERVRPMQNRDQLVTRFFSELEIEQFKCLPEELKTEAFFRGWTGKEAVLKCTGSGLRKLQDCAVELDPRRPASVIRYCGEPESGWALATWQPSGEHVASVSMRWK